MKHDEYQAELGYCYCKKCQENQDEQTTIKALKVLIDYIVDKIQNRSTNEE